MRGKGSIGLAFVVAALSTVTAFMLVISKVFRKKRIEAVLDNFDTNGEADSVTVEE